MKRPSIILLAVGLSALARPGSAQHEAPSHEDRSSGDDRSSSGDVGHNDPGDSGHSADSSPSSGNEAQGHDSHDVSGSGEASSSSSWGGDGDRGSHDVDDAGADRRGGERGSFDDGHASPGREEGGQRATDERNEANSAGDVRWADPVAESSVSPPPGARLRDPDSEIHPPTDAQQRHPRPDNEPDEHGSADPGLTDAYDPDDGWVHGDGEWPSDDRSADFPPHLRKPSRRVGSLIFTLRRGLSEGQMSVYVDGHYAGRLDAKVQRLFLSAGHHRVTLVQNGGLSYSLDVYVSEDGSTSVHAMEPNGPLED